MKISQALDEAVKNFKTAGIETPRLDTLILMEMVLGKGREYVIAHSEDELSSAQMKSFSVLSERRTAREPMAHITGKKQFYGREFKVTPDVLMPRPETELLVEAALRLSPKHSEINILDLGTGSGCIILTLIAELPKAHGIGADISNSALAIARENAYNLGIANVEFVKSDWCKNLDLKNKFQLIVSNPPYIPNCEAKNLPAELSYEPDAALFGGDDGLECYRRLAEEISAIDFNFAVFEIGIGQEREIEKIFDEYQIKLKEIIPDLAQIPRVMIFSKQ